MHYESDAKAYDIQYEYLFGIDMLIAPVYEQDKHEWDVYLPQDGMGTFVDRPKSITAEK